MHENNFKEEIIEVKKEYTKKEKRNKRALIIAMSLLTLGLMSRTIIPMILK